MGAALVAVAALAWGFWAIFLRPSGLAGPASAFVTFLVMAAPAPFVLRREALRDRAATAWLAVLAVSDAVNVSLVFAAIARGPVAIAVLTHYLGPLVLVLSAPLLLGERISARSLVAAPLTLGALLLVIGGDSRADLDLVTAALGAGSAIFFAISVASAKRAARAYSPTAVTSVHSVGSALLLVPVLGLDGLPSPLAAGTLRVAAGALVCGLGAGIVFNRGLRAVSGQTAGALTYLEPVAAAVVGAVVFGELMGPRRVAGAVMVIGLGVWVALGGRPALSPETPASPRTGPGSPRPRR